VGELSHSLKYLAMYGILYTHNQKKGGAFTMASKMINCKTCNAEIAASAKICPSCGAKNKKPIYKRWWFIVLVAIAVIVIGASLGGNGDDGTQTTIAPGAENQEQPIKEEKTPIVLIADDLMSALKENALNAANTYNGAYVEVTGKLSTIDSAGKYFSISGINNGFFLDTILCYIKKEHHEAVANLTRDQKVTVVGTIKSVGEVLGYSLDVESIK